MKKLNSKHILKIAVLGIIILLNLSIVKAQEAVTLEKALQIAEIESPDLQLSLLNLERFQKNLEAQRAAMKSRFSLNVSPIEYSNQRRFDNRTSEWYTNENLSSNARFLISQPIAFSDGTISLSNEFGWQKSSSTANNSESEVFYTILRYKIKLQ